jgi:chromosome segregation ATPase
MVERRQIVDGNSKLKAETEALQREHAVWVSAIEAIKERYSAHTAADLPIEEVAAMLKENFQKKREDHETAIQKASDTLVSLKSEITAHSTMKRAVEGVLVQRKGELAAIEASLETRKAEMRVEEARHASILENLQTAQTSARQDLDANLAQVAAIKQEQADKTEWILRESMRLSTRERDIAIYEDRVLRMGQKIDPEFKMIL